MTGVQTCALPILYFILNLRKLSFVNDSCHYLLLVVDDPYGRIGDRHKFSILSVIITILNFCAFYCSEQGGVLAPFFVTDEPSDDELVVEDD